MDDGFRYRGVWYGISNSEIFNESTGVFEYEGHTEFSKYFIQYSAKTYEECEQKIKKAIDIMKDNEVIDEKI